MIGFGFSDKPYLYEYSIMDQADIYDEFLNLRGVEEYHLFSHDYGDTVACERDLRRRPAQPDRCDQRLEIAVRACQRFRDYASRRYPTHAAPMTGYFWTLRTVAGTRESPTGFACFRSGQLREYLRELQVLLQRQASHGMVRCNPWSVSNHDRAESAAGQAYRKTQQRGYEGTLKWKTRRFERHWMPTGRHPT